MTAYVYDEARFDEALDLVDSGSTYGLTGAVFAERPSRRREARPSACATRPGNFYVNDKPTGAVVGQQPFGGARASGTNDKAGSIWNLIRWVSPRVVKETFVPPERLPLPVPRLSAARAPGGRSAPVREATPKVQATCQPTERSHVTRVADATVRMPDRDVRPGLSRGAP